MSGCLHPQAENFGCTTAGGTKKCASADGANTELYAPTVHDKSLCNWGEKDVHDHLPAFGDNDDIKAKAVIQMKAAGSVEDYTPTRKNDIKVKMDALTNPPAGSTTGVDVRAASVIIEYWVETTDYASVAAFKEAVKAKIGTTLAEVQANLGDLIGVKMLDVPTVTVEVEVLASRLPTAGIIGILVAVLVVAIGIGGVVWWYRRKRKKAKATYPA